MNRLEVCGVIAVAVALLAGGIWWDGHRAAERVAKPKIEAATDTAVVKTLEAQGGQHIQTQTEALLKRALVVQERTNALVVAIRSDPTAQGTLDPAVLERLRAHDQFLCDSDPGACDAPAAAPPARDKH